MKGRRLARLLFIGCMLVCIISLQGCGSKGNSSVTEIEIVQYKPEASNYFKMVEEEFNKTHDDIYLTINSPNDATAILRTRFIREDYPDIVGIGGDIEYSYYVDAQILEDISGILMSRWNLYQQKAHLLYHIWRMRQVFFITGIYLKRTGGKSQITGMSL